MESPSQLPGIGKSLLTVQFGAGKSHCCVSQKPKELGRNMKPGFSAVQNFTCYILKVVQYASKMIYKISEF